MKYKFLAIFLLISMILSANSIFSYYGMANQYLGNDLYSAGMSDAGKNDLFRINTSYSNPSILTSSNKVIFSTATSFGKQNYYDDNGSSFKDDGFYLPYFTAAFPVLNHRFGLQYSLLYSGNLDTYGTGVFTSEDEEEFSYDTKNSIISNVFKVDLSYALKNRFVNIGIAGNYYLGHRIQYWEYDFENSTLLDSEYEKEELFKNPKVMWIINMVFQMNRKQWKKQFICSKFRLKFLPVLPGNLLKLLNCIQLSITKCGQIRILMIKILLHSL